MYTVSNEKFSEISPFLGDMPQRHWDEAASPMYGKCCVVRLEQYQALEDAGVLYVVATRDKLKRVIAYGIYIISPCMHVARITATQCAIFVEKQYRGSACALQMMRTAESDLKAKGVHSVIYSSPESRSCAALFKRLGAKKTEEIYSKIL